jgi:hypothetical protein
LLAAIFHSSILQCLQLSVTFIGTEYPDSMKERKNPSSHHGQQRLCHYFPRNREYEIGRLAIMKEQMNPGSKRAYQLCFSLTSQTIIIVLRKQVTVAHYVVYAYHVLQILFSL